MKAGFLTDMMTAFKGDKKAQKKLISGGRDMKKAVSCCNNCCCCLPCAKQPVKEKRD